MSNRDNLLSALGRPYHGYHRSLHRKAAALLDGVSTGHGFVDGNKRTAWLLVELLVERSADRIDIPDDEPIDDLVVNVVEHRMTFDELAEWFRMRLKKTV